MSQFVETDWKYQIVIDEPDWLEVQHWCEAYIGEFDKEWYKLGIDMMESIMSGKFTTTWLFKEEKHAILFKLRWQ